VTPTDSVLSQLRDQRAGAPSGVAAEAAVPVVGSYVRISDAYEGRETGVTTEGVERQEQANEHIAKARGWKIAQVYADNNVSAFRENVVRDGFEDLLSDLESGVIEGIVCYNLDRFARRVNDLERAIALYDAAKRTGRPLYFATAEGDLNLASDDGLTLARVMVAFANKASRDTARRVAAKHQDNRDRGRLVGGRRPFGWSWEYDDNGKRTAHVQVEAEAEAIRWAAHGLTNGSLTWRDIVRTWNDQGLHTPSGRTWQPQTVKQVLRSPRLAGWRVHKDRIAVHSRTGELIRADVEPILTDAQFEALLEAINTRAGTYGASSGRLKYLLSGLARCQACGGRLVGNAQGRYFSYVCRAVDCAGMTASGKQLDAFVEGLVLPRVVAESKALRFMDVPPHGEELHELEEEREHVRAAAVAGEVPTDVAFPRIAEIDRRREELLSIRRMHALRQQQLAGVEMTPALWDTLDTEAKRVHVARHLEAVYVAPRTTNTGRYFDTARVSPVWRA
jgi:site-specific DNA recombinase